METSLTHPAEFTGPRIERVRHALKRRSLIVARIERITPAMLRLTFTGEDLADFTSLAPDDHIKVFVPAGGGAEERRDYTPRRYDPVARTLTIDFALHEAGPVTQWALGARLGDHLSIGGPRGSAVVSGEVRRWLLIGDETALPAIGRRIEEAPAGVQMTSIVAVAGPQDHQNFVTHASWDGRWAHRPVSDATDASALISHLQSVEIQPETFTWIAAEASVTRALRAYLTEERGFPLPWLKASGYWVKGRSDASEKFE